MPLVEIDKANESVNIVNCRNLTGREKYLLKAYDYSKAYQRIEGHTINCREKLSLLQRVHPPGEKSMEPLLTGIISPCMP